MFALILLSAKGVGVGVLLVLIAVVAGYAFRGKENKLVDKVSSTVKADVKAEATKAVSKI
jgi:hypothetical protein